MVRIGDKKWAISINIKIHKNVRNKQNKNIFVFLKKKFDEWFEKFSPINCSYIFGQYISAIWANGDMISIGIFIVIWWK